LDKVADKAARSRLLTCMEHRVEVEAWRATLEPGQRAKYNHPQTVLSRWKAATQESVATPKKPTQADLLAESVRQLTEENDALLEKIKGEQFGDWSATRSSAFFGPRSIQIATRCLLGSRRSKRFWRSSI
jgi:hypothetical protein